MGLENAGSTPNAEQLAAMAAIVAEGMEAGAMGLCASRSANHRSAGDAGSTGMTGDLAPGFYSTDDELVTLAKAVAKVNKGMIFQCISRKCSSSLFRLLEHQSQKKLPVQRCLRTTVPRASKTRWP